MLDLPLNIDYSGKVVVVTGAGGLICGTMARAFAQLGAKVAALDLNEEAVKKLAEELKAEDFPQSCSRFPRSRQKFRRPRGTAPQAPLPKSRKG